MASRTVELRNVALEGEIIEIVEEGERRFAKVKLTDPIIVDLPHTDHGDTHLGDLVVVHVLGFGLGGPREEL